MLQEDKNKQIEMLNINKGQTNFYDSDTYHKKGNIFLRFWRWLRYRIDYFRKDIGIDKDIYDLHKKWLGDLSDKKVLDLGCLSGNYLSLFLAENANQYIAIDLSKFGIEKLKSELLKRNLVNANAFVVDFLSPDFTEKDFDIIYAHGVIHHFKHLDLFLKIAFEKLKSNGKIITLDPLETPLSVRILRILYRPFQPDKEWEYPFNKNTFKLFQKYFKIEYIQGYSGYVKWAFFLAIISRKLALKIGKMLHKKDMKEASKIGKGLWRCMAVIMCLRKE